MSEHDVLQGFYEEPLPPSGVDIGRAIRTGRGRRRARSGVAALGAVAVLAIGAIAGPQWTHWGWVDGHGAGPAGAALQPCPGSRPLATAPPVAPSGNSAPGEFAVLRHWVTLGEGTGLQLTEVDTARYWQRVTYTDTTGHTVVDVQAYAGGGVPAFASEPSTAPTPVDPTTGTPADPVDGSPAYWLPGHQGLDQYEVARLGWQWAPGGWVFVAAADTRTDGQDTPLSTDQLTALRSVVSLVATAVRIGPGSAVASPFTVPVPGCTRLTGTSLLRSTKGDGTPFVRFGLSFGPDGTDSHSAMLSPPSAGQYLLVADSGEVPADKPGSADTTVDGHPARVNGPDLTVFGVDGYALEVTVPPGSQDAVTLAGAIRIVADGQHQENWTATPLR